MSHCFFRRQKQPRPGSDTDCVLLYTAKAAVSSSFFLYSILGPLVATLLQTMMIASPPNSLSGTKKPATEENNTLSSSNSNVPRAKKQSPVLLLVGLCCIISGFFNIFNAHWLHGASSSSSTEAFHKTNIFHRNRGAGRGGAIQHAMREFLKGKEGLQTTSRKRNRVENTSYLGESQVEPHDEVGHETLLGQTKIVDPSLVDTGNWGDATHPNTLATLSCEAHGGPTTEEAQEMVYWHDIPSDTKYKSPLFQRDGVERFLTFEPDGGGWNNIRMAMETVIGLAIATGRTLVLPPQQRMYLLGKDRGKQRTDFDFDHFFPIYDMAAENDGLSVITMKEFLERVAMKGEMRNKETGAVEYPPEMRTDWDGQDVKILKEWLRNVTHTPLWSPGQCLAAFPSDASTEAVDRLHHHLIKARSKPLKNPIAMEHPPSVDSPPEYRLRENLAGRKELCIYDTQMQKETVIHFMCYHKMRVRMLVHFYAFLFFEDYREDLWMKRFMRDHIRYKDPIQCAAARIVSALRKEFGEFDTFHVRRGDFQVCFCERRISAVSFSGGLTALPSLS